MKSIKNIIDTINKTSLFQQAFTHSSWKNEVTQKAQKDAVDYETLEFLGDSILGFQVSLYIYQNYPSYSEGQMTKLKQFMVQEKTLADLSKKAGLFRYLKLGAGEKKNKAGEKASVLADIFESFIAALYLEKGEKVVKEFLKITLFSWSKGKEEQIWDYKTQLQELCQAQHNRLFYRVIKNRNETENQQFIVEAYDKLGKFNTQGRGKSKKIAEQEAAFNALKKLNN